jgi:CDP-paratose 2-epimerase
MDLIAEMGGERPQVRHADWRSADQRWFVADTRQFGVATGWRPQVDAPRGVAELYRWFSHAATPNRAAKECVA